MIDRMRAGARNLVKSRQLILAALLAGSFVPAALSAAAAEDIVAMISQYRRAHGLPAVHHDAALAAVAQRQAQAMAARGIMDHNVAGSFASRVADANVGHAGENIAMGAKSWSQALHVWEASPGHNHNLLMPDATRIGVAMAYGGSRHTAYWAMVIGGAGEPRRVRVRGKHGESYVMGVPLMIAGPSHVARARNASARDASHKGEITGNE